MQKEKLPVCVSLNFVAPYQPYAFVDVLAGSNYEDDNLFFLNVNNYSLVTNNFCYYHLRGWSRGQKLVDNKALLS